MRHYFSIVTTLLASILLFTACKMRELQIPPVSNFKLEKYLGTWYEIARVDNSFERGCTHTTASYTMSKDGKIKVLNKCKRNGKIDEINGIATFKRERDVGAFNISFFWPFYGSYYVVFIDEGYNNAIIYGGSRKYAWILSREQSISKEMLAKFFEKAESLGLEKESFMLVSHD